MGQRFCKEVAVMKQFEHKNILPFYGVSTTVSDFCLVFPWYKNGNIMDYLKMNPEINQFQLVSMLGQITYSSRLPTPGNSYRVRSEGCSSYTTMV